jgi:hypothetical protein
VVSGRGMRIVGGAQRTPADRTVVRLAREK